MISNVTTCAHYVALENSHNLYMLQYMYTTLSKSNVKPIKIIQGLPVGSAITVTPNWYVDVFRP